MYLSFCIPVVNIHSKKVLFFQTKPNLRFAFSITKLITRDQKKKKSTGTYTSSSFSSVLKEKSVTHCQTRFLKPVRSRFSKDLYEKCLVPGFWVGHKSEKDLSSPSSPGCIHQTNLFPESLKINYDIAQGH